MGAWEISNHNHVPGGVCRAKKKTHLEQLHNLRMVGEETGQPNVRCARVVSRVCIRGSVAACPFGMWRIVARSLVVACGPWLSMAAGMLAGALPISNTRGQCVDAGIETTVVAIRLRLPNTPKTKLTWLSVRSPLNGIPQKKC
jgi:hypothetical protein